MENKKFDKIDKIVSITLSVVAVIIISLVGTVLLKMETADRAVVMMPETEYEETQTNETESQTVLININAAPVEDLILLPGIGTTKAEAIVTYREKTPFAAKEDIMKVKGIGESLFREISDKICVE